MRAQKVLAPDIKEIPPNISPLPLADEQGFFISISRFPVAITCVIGFLLVANLGALFVQHILDHPEVWGLVPLFHFDREQNLPTFFSALMLLTSSGLLMLSAVNARKMGQKPLPWAFLALAFLFLSIDETASLHEKLDALIHHYTPTSGILHYAWVAPYGLAVLALGIVLAPWFFRLQRRTQVLFALSGAFYVGGALGIEIISGLYYSSAAGGAEVKTLFGDLLATIEELSEMTGVAIFIYALLSHLCGDRREVRLRFS